ncbi:hypothetical protein CC80DRAFT_593483 [Byssothecium circinans]|uniref:NADP-dependent oxidoreductase domain-containing protein n=1 Tax=Byssothecium circinans TaxID=147558 RepID=A0A6A5TWS6_9PLEO|nr:hypothetical protein CC80DRAFT_593483 [Byssothecium circinans]
MAARTLKGMDSSGAHAKKACEESLRELRVDCIDLCELPTCCHPDSPIKETIRALAELKAQNQTHRPCKISSPITAVQTEYSSLARDSEFPLSHQPPLHLPRPQHPHHLLLPLGRDLLSGIITSPSTSPRVPDVDARTTHIPWFSAETFDANMNWWTGGRNLLRKSGVSSQLALA